MHAAPYVLTDDGWPDGGADLARTFRVAANYIEVNFGRDRLEEAGPEEEERYGNRAAEIVDAWFEVGGERAAREIEAIALATLRERLGDVHGSAALGSLAARVAAGDADPYTAADSLLATYTD